MPHRTAQRRLGRIRRRTLVGRVLGLSPDSHIDGLKQYLHAATLTQSPTEKLDLIMIEDYEHFAELIAQDGIPLAREDSAGPVGRTKWVVHIPGRWFVGSILVYCALQMNEWLGWHEPTVVHVLNWFGIGIGV